VSVHASTLNGREAHTAASVLNSDCTSGLCSNYLCTQPVGQKCCMQIQVSFLRFHLADQHRHQPRTAIAARMRASRVPVPHRHWGLLVVSSLSGSSQRL
jgi:hypothetical protein